MPICLQGGAEFGTHCHEMDATLVSMAGAGPVVVLPLAAESGSSYDASGRHGARYFTERGATSTLVVEDPRRGGRGAKDAIRDASMVVLPGGSPARLLDALREYELDLAIADALAAGAVVMGASAGAMVLCGLVFLPERGGVIVEGLGLVPDVLVVAHWDSRQSFRLQEMRARLDEDEVVIGIPEQSGLLVDRRLLRSMGRNAPTLLGGRAIALSPGSEAVLGWELGWERG